MFRRWVVVGLLLCLSASTLPRANASITGDCVAGVDPLFHESVCISATGYPHAFQICATATTDFVDDDVFVQLVADGFVVRGSDDLKNLMDITDETVTPLVEAPFSFEPLSTSATACTASIDVEGHTGIIKASAIAQIGYFTTGPVVVCYFLSIEGKAELSDQCSG